MELIYLDHVEWYLGERVLRQFGIYQPVPDPPPQSFHVSRTGGAARYSLLETLRDQIRHFNAGGDFFEMHLTDREGYVEWYASVSTGPTLSSCFKEKLLSVLFSLPFFFLLNKSLTCVSRI